MSAVETECQSGEGRQGWASVIVDPPSHPVGSNENTASLGVVQASVNIEALLTAIRSAGHRVREADLQVQARTDQLRELIAWAGEHLRAAVARAEQAEAREQETRRWAQAAVEEAEERVRAAEQRAQTAEAWLVHVADVIEAEFPDCSGSQPVGDQQAA